MMMNEQGYKHPNMRGKYIPQADRDAIAELIEALSAAGEAGMQNEASGQHHGD